MIDAEFTDRLEGEYRYPGLEPKITACPECGGAGVLFMGYEEWLNTEYGNGVRIPIHPQLEDDEQTWEAFPPADGLLIGACLTCRCSGLRLPYRIAKPLEMLWTYTYPALMALAIAKGEREGYFDGVELPRRFGMYRHMLRHAYRDSVHTRERMKKYA